MKTCQVCSRWKIKHPLNETFARWAWCLIRVRHFLKQFEIAKGRRRHRIKAETWVNIAIFPTYRGPSPGGHSLVSTVRVRAAGQGMVFSASLRCPKKGIQFGLPLSLTGLKPVLNMVWYYGSRDLGPVQTPLHSCAEPNWWIKSGKRTASESIRYGSFNSVRQRC